MTRIFLSRLLLVSLAILSLIVTALYAQESPTYLPGDTPTVGDIEHRTVEEFNPDRLVLGIGEEMYCWIDSGTWVDKDIELWSYGQITVDDAPGEVLWTVSGPGKVYPSVATLGTYVLLVADINETGGEVTLEAEIWDSKTKGLDGPVQRDQKVNVKPPKGFDILSQKTLVKMGWKDGAKYLGQASEFRCQMTPVDVTFHKVQFAEDIPEQNFKWPDGTAETLPKAVLPFKVFKDGTDNCITTDQLSRGLDPVERLKGKDFEWNRKIPCKIVLETDKDGNPTKMSAPFITEDHLRQAVGDNSVYKTGKVHQLRAVLKANNSLEGNWQGPWDKAP